ncbi:MAG: SMC-Scp complex subunit ScpB [Clostridia bacterium]|nr:SMC-Scp complex subunit ScpB [Clostridia bacterium]
MIPSDTIASLQAVLFACGGPVEQERLRELLNISSAELDEAAEELRSMLENPRCGIQLITVENAYQLCTKSFIAETVKKALELRKTPPLSKASLEVLAIVAYNQPVTRSFIETVRGVDSSSIVSSLCDKGLLTERGFLDAPGRPVLFGTTDAFLRCFGLESIKDLPEADLSELPEQLTISESTEDLQTVPEAETAAADPDAAEADAEEAAEGNPA